MTALCLHYLSLECFEENLDVLSRSNFAEESFFAFQDYAVAHWIDHLLSLLELSRLDKRDQKTQEKEISDACVLFDSRYGAELQINVNDQTCLLDRSQYAALKCFPILCALWNHGKTSRSFVDDKRDEVSLQSLKRSFNDNRKALEILFAESKSEKAMMAHLTDIYGTKWFKCTKITCYYFHEGFETEPARKDHYNRHERPFRCEEENCHGAVFGFGSLKELEKHRRNMHPGIDKLSATFARLKKGRNSKMDLGKYPCPRCTNRFPSRLECRIHMAIHNPRLGPKVSRGARESRPISTIYSS